MGKYCKAYYLGELRKYPNWTEKPENAKWIKEEIDGKDVEFQEVLTDESIVFIQENYLVTHGMFMDEFILFDNVTDEWISFCKNELGFIIPAFDQ